MPITFQEAVVAAERRKVVLPAEYYGQIQGEKRSLSFSVAGVAARDQLQGVLDSLNAVLRGGGTFESWKSDPSVQSLGLTNDRLDNIFRTNMQSAYSQGHWTQQQRTRDRRPWLMYDAVNDSRTRPSHLELDNVIRRIADPFWDAHYPPNGFRCRCSTISLTEAQARARGGETSEPDGGWLPPDRGWDYNPGADPSEGTARASQPRPLGNSDLQRAMRESVADRQASQIHSMDSVLHGKEQTLDGSLAGMRASKAEAMSVPSPEMMTSARAVSNLTEIEQTYLRLVARESSIAENVFLSVPEAVGLRGDLGSSAESASARVLSVLGEAPVTAPELYRAAAQDWGLSQAGDSLVLHGYAPAYATKPSGIRAIVVRPGSTKAYPVDFLAEDPGSGRWLLVPGTKLTVVKTNETGIYVEAT